MAVFSDFSRFLLSDYWPRIRGQYLGVSSRYLFIFCWNLSEIWSVFSWYPFNIPCELRAHEDSLQWRYNLLDTSATTRWKARNPVRSRQHARHSCRAGCIVFSENPQGLATRMVHLIFGWYPMYYRSKRCCSVLIVQQGGGHFISHRRSLPALPEAVNTFWTARTDIQKYVTLRFGVSGWEFNVYFQFGRRWNPVGWKELLTAKAA